MTNPAHTARWFATFATTHGDRSPLYRQLALGLADDPEILPMAISPIGQPPHILFGAVHYLLLRGVEHALAEYYPSVASSARSPESAYPVFRAFCLEHRDEISQLVATRIVQTNEVTRCSYLYLAAEVIAAHSQGRPLSLVEIGASAGLNLLFDLYGYSYDGVAAGNSQSAVQIQSSLRGDISPAIPATAPEVIARYGIDLNPIDLDDADERLWLRSMIWPDQPDRAELMARAIDVAREHRPELRAGDALEHLPSTIEMTDFNSAICLYHTHTIHTWPQEQRDALMQLITQLASDRQIYHLSAEWLGPPATKLQLEWWPGGKPESVSLAYCDDHGRWIEWLER